MRLLGKKERERGGTPHRKLVTRMREEWGKRDGEYRGIDEWHGYIADMREIQLHGTWKHPIKSRLIPPSLPSPRARDPNET